MGGARVHGLAEWRATLSTLEERAQREFRGVMKHGGVNMRLDWKGRWELITHPKGHIPHLLRGLGFDLDEPGPLQYHLEVGVHPRNRQAFLAEIIEYGSHTSPPHPAGEAVLEREVPNIIHYAEKVAADLLERNR